MRKTNYIVYVDKDTLDNPDKLFDAVFAHLIKRECPIPKRRVFMSLFTRAYSPETQMKVIGDWVQVRDIETFPFRNEAKSTLDEWEGVSPPVDTATPEGKRIVDDAAKEVFERVKNEADEGGHT